MTGDLAAQMVDGRRVRAWKETRNNSACPDGRPATPPLDDVQREVEPARAVFTGLNAAGQLQLMIPNEGQGLPGSEETLTAFLGSACSHGCAT